MYLCWKKLKNLFGQKYFENTIGEQVNAKGVESVVPIFM